VALLKRKVIDMEHNENKYRVEDCDVLSDAEKVQFAKDLLELERQGILEYREGTWRLLDGVEIEETPDGPVARFRNQNVTAHSAVTNSVASSGEPSETRVPPLEQAAQPLSQGPGSPDSDDEVNKR
jgi:hypothetical protein